MSAFARFRRSAACLWLVAACLVPGSAQAAGEPANDFLKRLRAAGYFDVAIIYLDRIDEYPGVDPNLKSAVPLEKAQTYIDAAVATRNPKTRDGYFVKAENQLNEFLKQSSHPRLSEARLQLGKLQMVRGAQLMSGQPSDEQRVQARESYLAAAETFDAIVEDLRERLRPMQGAKIDAQKEPEKAALRDQYRGEFLQGQINSGEARKLAALTYRQPAVDGKELLEQALAKFTELTEKYDGYVQGALAMLSRGQVQQELGMKVEALDSYIRMLEQPEADPLRDSKFQATSGMIRLWLDETPPKYTQAIERGQALIDDVRPDERRTASVQELRIQLAKAYLEKTKDTENLKSTEIKRAETSGRQLLLTASKIPGEYMEQAQAMLVDLGIRDEEVAVLPTTEDPDGLVDALDKARELWEASENISQSIKVLEDQGGGDAAIEKQKQELSKQLVEMRSVAIQILRRGLAMIEPNVDIETLNQARQFLAYLLYDSNNYRDAAVVGTFLAQYAPGQEIGLRGGVVALNSYQLLLSEVPTDENESLIDQLEQLGDFLTKTWPNDPKAAAAQGVRVRVALSKDRWEDARALVEQMPEGSERASFERLMGQLHWNESIKARNAGDDEKVASELDNAQRFLQQGLDGIPTELVDPEAAKAALILAKVYLKQGDAEQAEKILTHATYGPKTILAKQGHPDPAFPSDLYSAELQTVVRLMMGEGDPEALLKRATDVMDKLRESVAGADAQSKLTAIYMRMARDIREQLDEAQADKKTKLIDAFRIFLDRIAETTKDTATLQWDAQTLLELGEASMPQPQGKAVGQAALLLQSAVATFEDLKKRPDAQALTIDYQLGRAYRLLGRHKDSIDALESVLKQKPTMLDAQIEAAQAYEDWAAVVPPRFAGKAYESALNGARPDRQGKKTIWGWGRISLMTNGKPQYQTEFFNARYHVALCRLKWGRAINSNPVKEKAITDITQVAALFPQLGGPKQRKQFDSLLKTIQGELGKPAKGLPPLK